MSDTSRSVGQEQVSGEMHLGGPATLDGQPVRAMAVLSGTLGDLAIWLIDLAGEPCGAWRLTAETREEARMILGLCDRRALIVRDGSQACDLLREVAGVGSVNLSDDTIRRRIASVSILLEQTAKAREVHAEAVRSYGLNIKTRLVPLTYKADVPDSVEDLVRGLPPLEPGIPEALMTARLAKKALELWIDTESVRLRRPALVEQFGPLKSLPENWQRAAVTAYSEPFSME